MSQIEVREDVTRYCKICNKRLSKYNKGYTCYYHQPEEVFEYIPITLCTSYYDENDNARISIAPGYSTYNDTAFTKVSKGYKNFERSLHT